MAASLPLQSKSMQHHPTFTVLLFQATHMLSVNFDLCAASALLSVSPQEGCHHSHQCSHQGPQGRSLSSGAHHQAADCKTDPIYCTPWQEASYCQQKGEEE